jgi:16S rRNA (guanine527-N7)-methyltransferase
MNAGNPAASLDADIQTLLGRALQPLERERVLAYLELLQRWNSAYNLTAIREPGEMVVRHVLDSLAVLPFIGHGPVLDAGTGAGLPGVPLAILKPEQQFTLLDSIGKKIRFLRQVKRELGLPNIHPVQARLETHLPVQPYEIIVSRAFSSLADIATGSRQLMTAGTRLLAMKGQDPLAERRQLPGWIRVDSVQELAVPGLQEQRHLVIMSLTQKSDL